MSRLSRVPRLSRVGVLLVDDATFWGGMQGLWKYILSRFGKCSDGVELIPIDAITGDLLNEEVDLYDGFIITGSNYSVNDQHPWIKHVIIFIQWIASMDKHKMFGICFGHQLIAKSFGCIVGRNISGKDVFKTQELQLSETLLEKDYYQRVFGNRTNFKIMEAHGESIISLSGKCKVVGWSDTCDHEVVLWSEKIISTQGHPEFHVDVMLNKIAPMAKEHGFITDEVLEVSSKTFSDIDTNNTVMLVKSFFMK